MQSLPSEQQKEFTPLNLPLGSVRAILTISIALTTLFLALFFPDQVPNSLRNVFIVAVAFYYSSRATVYPQVSQPKTLKRGPSPLFLPAATVRISLALITGIVIVLTLLGRNEIPSFLLTVLITIVGFTLGVLVKEITLFISARIKKPSSSSFDFKTLMAHLQAAIILIVVLVVCAIDLFVPLFSLILSPELIIFLNQILELVIGYYFGSRISRRI